MLTAGLGCTLIMIISPLAADLSYVVEHKEQQDPSAFGGKSAYAQAFALFNCSMGAATLFGPIFAGYIRTKLGWDAMSVILGVFALSGALPTVSSLVYFVAWKKVWLTLHRSSILDGNLNSSNCFNSWVSRSNNTRRILDYGRKNYGSESMVRTRVYQSFSFRDYKCSNKPILHNHILRLDCIFPQPISLISFTPSLRRQLQAILFAV